MEVALTAARGVGIQRCPRCDTVPHEITVLEVAVDFCTGCGGVWLDGGEYDEKGAVGKTQRGGRAPYRRAAVESSNELSCAHCGVPLSRERALVREHGATCEPCSFALDQRIAALRAEADPLNRFLQRVAEILLD